MLFNLGVSGEKTRGSSNSVTTTSQNRTGTTTTNGSTTVSPWDFAQPYIQGVLNRGVELASQPQSYGPSRFVPATDMQQQSWETLLGAGQQIGGLANSGINTVNDMLNMPNTIADNPQIKAMLDQQRSGANLTLQQMMDNQNLGFNQASSALGNQYQGLQEKLGAQWDTANYLNNRNLNENILPGLRAGAAASGGANQLGSSRQGIAQGVATRGANEYMQNLSAQHQAELSGLAREGGQTLSNLAQNNTLAQQQAAQSMQQQLNQNAANTYFGGWNSALQQQQYGMGNLGSLANLSMMPGEIQGAVGGEQRGLLQERQNELANQHQWAQQVPWEQLRNIQGLLGLQSGYSTTTGTGTSTTNEQLTGTTRGQERTTGSSIGFKANVGGQYGG